MNGEADRGPPLPLIQVKADALRQSNYTGEACQDLQKRAEQKKTRLDTIGHVKTTS